MAYERVPERVKEYNRYRRTFPRKANERRCELIDKMESGFTAEDRSRPFADHRGWKEESDRREHANLTEAERQELAELTAVVDAWQSAAPWARDQKEMMAKHEADMDRIEARMKKTDRL